MSCEIYIDDNAEEYDITVSGDSTCDEIDITVELEGETVSTETDPVFLAHPVYAIATGDISHWNAGYAFTTSHLSAYDHTDIHEAHSDAETASTIGTLIGGVAAATPAATDVFPFVQTIGNTLKKITLTNLAAAVTAGAGAEPLFTASPAYGITTGDIAEWNEAYGWGDHATAGYSTTGHDHATLYDAIGSASGSVGQHELTYDHDTFIASGDIPAETDPVFTAHPVYAIASGDIDNWDTAYGWGDHSAQGYATTGDLLDYSTTGHDHDTLYEAIGSASAEVATHESTYNHGEYDTAYGWGDHSTAGYATTGDLIDYSTTGHDHDIVYDAIGSASAEVATHELTYDHGTFITSGDIPTETDPVFTASPAASVTTGDIAEWNIAYGWGDHSTAGYSTTGHDHDTLYDIIGAASAEVEQHELDYDHTLIATALQPSSLNGYTTTGDLLDYSTTGHDHDTLYDSIGAASGAVGQHEIDYDHTLIAEAMPKATQITSITLASGLWGASGDLYEYDYANAAITADTIVDVIPDNEDIEVVKAAEILPKTVSSAGSVKLYATNAPTNNIGVTMNLTTKA